MFYIYTVLERNGQYLVCIENLVGYEYSAIATMANEEFAKDYCDKLNIAYDCGYEHGVNSCK